MDDPFIGLFDSVFQALGLNCDLSLVSMMNGFSSSDFDIDTFL